MASERIELNTEPGTYTLNEVAAKLRVSRQVASAMARRGEFPVVICRQLSSSRGRPMAPRRAFDRWLEAGCPADWRELLNGPKG